MSSTRDYIMVLGFWNHPDGTLPEPTLARLDKGLEVYRQNPHATVILSGGFGDNFNVTQRPHAEYSADYLKSKGIPAKQIIVFPEPSHTVAEAIAAAQYLENKSCDTLFLVTAAIHMPRAELIFKHFFETPPLQSIVAPNHGIDPAKLALYEAREREKIALFKAQGGVLVNGQLVKIKESNKMT